MFMFSCFISSVELPLVETKHFLISNEFYCEEFQRTEMCLSAVSRALLAAVFTDTPGVEKRAFTESSQVFDTQSNVSVYQRWGPAVREVCLHDSDWMGSVSEKNSSSSWFVTDGAGHHHHWWSKTCLRTRIRAAQFSLLHVVIFVSPLSNVVMVPKELLCAVLFSHSPSAELPGTLNDTKRFSIHVTSEYIFIVGSMDSPVPPPPPVTNSVCTVVMLVTTNALVWF